ncbi:hypothetical protein F5B19DRAFT_486590 [Rostrohypoxylon terebratum]|nr:hypothetical protein F5B19DRAFT_486590 [Rostrohypoxylon terebratum]
MTSILEEEQKNYEPRSKKKSPAKIQNTTTTTTLDTEANVGTEADRDLKDAESLAEFADYIAAETFHALPVELRTLDYHTYSKDTTLQSRYALPLTGSNTPLLLPSLDPSIADSLSAYGITREPAQGIDEFLAPVLTSYLTTLTTAPPPPRSTLRGAQGCELCGRDWIDLSYHHLIPRFVHAKAVRRGWHREEDLQNVAWLCGACHKFVHRFAGHEELARKYYTVELLMAEEGVRRWVDWVGRLRWKGR